MYICIYIIYILVDGHRLISHKGTAYGGVAILIHADLATHIVSQEHFGDRVLAVRIHILKVKFTAIAVYMPHAGYSIDKLRDTYACVTRATDWAGHYSRNYIIGGDFNTALSTGPRYQLMYNMILENNLSTTNEQFEDSIDEKFTFQNSLGVRRQLD